MYVCKHTTLKKSFWKTFSMTKYRSSSINSNIFFSFFMQKDKFFKRISTTSTKIKYFAKINVFISQKSREQIRQTAYVWRNMHKERKKGKTALANDDENSFMPNLNINKEKKMKNLNNLKQKRFKKKFFKILNNGRAWKNYEILIKYIQQIQVLKNFPFHFSLFLWETKTAYMYIENYFKTFYAAKQ